MNKCERVYAALEGQPVDRVPLSLWRHFHKQDRTPAGLASATLAFYHKYDFDLIKLTPGDFYAIADWGAPIAYSRDDDQPPRLKKPVIKNPDDWRHLTTLSPTEGAYAATLEAVKLVADQLGRDDAPLLMTVFSPMTIAYQLAGQALLEHLQTHSTDVQIGLATIAETTSRFALAALEAGADGIFLTGQFSRSDLLTEKMCLDFVVRYDLIALERIKDRPAPLVLHLHGEHVYFDTCNQYPVHAVSWHNHETGPSLAEALSLTHKTLMTGLDTALLAQGQPEAIVAQARAAMETAGQRLILAPACTIPPATPPENLEAISRLDRVASHALANLPSNSG
ncbi:MAG: uroporphyrinogen decarboxylase family protein [Chloroflexota bacterium]